MKTGTRVILLTAAIAVALAACSPGDEPATSASNDDRSGTATATANSHANAAPESVSQDEIDQALSAQREAIKAFATSLQGELQAAMAEGGPANAVSVCQSVAPQIAADLGEEHGIEIGRTSLRVRNPDNQPDTWERLVLENFENRVAAGESAADLKHHEVVVDDSGMTLRYMQSIPTGGLCLTCHGSDLHADVKPALERLYPDDQAVGFNAGDLRGAFTVRQRM